VTDITWMRDLTSLSGWMMPGETKTFGLAELHEATEWAAG
jgi:SpoIIAA-like